MTSTQADYKLPMILTFDFWYQITVTIFGNQINSRSSNIHGIFPPKSTAAYDRRHNTISRCSHVESLMSGFDGDGRAEILVTSPWGIGILKLAGNTLNGPMMAANGTRFDGWLLNTADNHFVIG